nr:hypothetical protein Puna18p_00085 [Serratia proteamaculans]
MKIELIISTHTLKGSNTDNKQYAEAVLSELQLEYPEYEVSVELSEIVTCDVCWVSDDPDGKIEKNVHMILNHVWCKADWIAW